MELEELSELIEDHIREQNQGEKIDLFADIMNWLESLEEGSYDETDIIYLASEFEAA